MTTPIVPTVTEELVAELEAAANAAKSARPGSPWYYQEGADVYTHIVRVDNPELNNSMIVTQLAQRTDGVSESVGRHIAITNPDNILALLAERADLKRQLAAASIAAERYLFLRNLHYDLMGSAGIPCAAIPSSSISGVYANGYDLDAAIDAARDIAAMDIGSGY